MQVRLMTALEADSDVDATMDFSNNSDFTKATK